VGGDDGVWLLVSMVITPEAELGVGWYAGRVERYVWSPAGPIASAADGRAMHVLYLF
jgi:hypothetical protein